MLREEFFEHGLKYSDNSILVDECWLEILRQYSNKKRYYHTLEHLDNLLYQLKLVRDHIQDWDTILFTLFYHDIVYNSLNSDNEEKSAQLAEKRLRLLEVPISKIELCKNQILATKNHLSSNNDDTNYFTDADLCVLGLSWNAYSGYYTNVRKEYSIYPSFIYNPGRKKVLNHFLSMDRIFKTDLFYEKFEAKARINIQREIELL
jgi:predicted metal-dependent HD superfamily phosphohydrolase